MPRPILCVKINIRKTRSLGIKMIFPNTNRLFNCKVRSSVCLCMRSCDGVGMCEMKKKKKNQHNYNFDVALELR